MKEKSGGEKARQRVYLFTGPGDLDGRIYGLGEVVTMQTAFDRNSPAPNTHGTENANRLEMLVSNISRTSGYVAMALGVAGLTILLGQML